ncbi:MAG: helix-turn-helix domain-containing protein, partial [Acidobacteria bacterium]|nr:helix-turn-helix domain-containing protein [Acidobacteriota bacterium]
MKLNKKNVRKDAGKRLAEFRKGLDYDRAGMAAYLGLTLNNYYKNETGIYFPGLDTLYQLATKNNLSMDWFFFNRGPMYFDNKEKIKEIEELRSQLELEQNKHLTQENA